MVRRLPQPKALTRQLCQACALCCNGVLFKDVELQPQDDPIRLEAAALTLQRTSRKTTLAQPCKALCQDRSCSIYAQRPARCREFDCQLLRETAAGRTSLEAALRTIQQATRRVERVRKLLARLEAQPRSELPLSVRFRRLQRAMERKDLDADDAGVWADLTLSVQRLNFLLSQRFLVSPPPDSRASR